MPSVFLYILVLFQYFYLQFTIGGNGDIVIYAFLFYHSRHKNGTVYDKNVTSHYIYM